MSPSRIFIERPIATSLLMIGILLAGGVAYRQLPVSALPEVDYPTIQVITFYPGASPEVMASSVTAPLERQFGEMPGLQQMTSTSSDGSSVITLQFSLSTNIDVGEQEVQQSINAAGTYLPADLPIPPIYNKINPADAPILTLALTSKTLPLPKVEDLADTRFAPKISQLPGVGLVSITGGQKPAVRVRANPTMMASYGLNLEDLRSVLIAASVNLAKGSFDGKRQSYQINSNDQLLSSEDFAPLVVAYRNGAPVKLTDIATVEDGVENVRQAAWMNMTPAVIMNIQRQPGANIISVVDRIRLLLPQLTATLPKQVQVIVLTDRTNTIRASVADVQFELVLTIGLVVMVIFLFLRTLAATIIPGVAVPLSLVGTFGAMYMLGYSLNNLTLMALTISTGFVVDDAIVMIENITRYIEQGQAPLEAALRGSEQIGFTIISLTISLIAVLIPLLFMGDIVGRLFREFANTLSVTILLSAVVSLTLTPMMCSKLLRRKSPGQEGRFYAASERVFNSVINFYGRTLRIVLRFQTTTLLIAVGTLALTFLLFMIIPKGFFPIQDTGVIQGISQTEQSISFSEMARRQQALADVILRDPAVENLSSFIGIDGTNTTLNSGRILMTLKPLAERKITASDVIRRLQPQLARVPSIALFMQPVQDLTVEDRVSAAQFQYTLEAPSSDELNTYATRMLKRLQEAPELRDVASDQQIGGKQTKLVYDRQTAARLGITASAIDQTLYDAYGQREISVIFTQSNQYRVVLEAKPQFQKNPVQLSDLYIRTDTGFPPGTTGAVVEPASTSSASTGVVSGGASTAANTTGPTSTGSAPITNAAGLPATTAASSAVFNGIVPASTAYPTGGQIPLRTFSHIENISAPIAINHQGQFPVVTLSFNLDKNASLGAAVNTVDRIKTQLRMPASIQGAFQGTAAAFQASLANEPVLILATIIVVYIVLGVLYESYIHPITIISTLPSAAVGALLALMLFQQDFSIIALIGIVLLIGIVKKNAIMMIDFALDAERNEGKTPLDAIYQACLLRFRPIMMTTMAALLAGIPLALGSGTGSELRRPLGISIVGGLLVSQLLTLYTTPLVYLFFDRFAGRFRRREPVAP
jgi:multidrug efflux pump